MATTMIVSAPAEAALPDGFRVPAEEAPHEATFMQWPVSRRVYRDRVFLEMTQAAIAEVAATIVEFEPVILLAHPDDHDEVRRTVPSSVELWPVPTEDLWCRDAGALIATGPGGRRAVSQLNFNGWGGKQVHTRDGRIAGTVAKMLYLPLYDSGIVGEAGGVEQDGHGLLMAHASSWVIDNRNPNLSEAEVTARLLAAYGAERMIWAPGLAGQDITDYHIDSLARFTGPGRVLIQLPDDPDPRDPFHQAALETHDILEAAGLEIEVIPDPVETRVTSRDFVASYANYYVVNGGVIAAQFGDAEIDRIAAEALARHYPGREVVQLNVDPLGELGGGIHCATQQLPAA